MRKVIAIDLGGTKILTAVINQDGKILQKIKADTHLSDGWNGLKKQIIQICQNYIDNEKNIYSIGIGSAGPLNAREGTLLDPTNFGWNSNKKVFIKRELEKALKKPIAFENDALASVLGEAWMGNASDNSISITLGTGLGVGVLVNGQVLRGFDGMHPELGHLILRPDDAFSHCECGAAGCAEGFLSGVNFAKTYARKYNLPEQEGKKLELLAAKGNKQVLAEFDDYAKLMAQFISSLILISYPKHIILSGSFANASPYFLKKTILRVKLDMKKRQLSQKIIPQIKISKLNNQNGLFGAAYMALNYKTYHKGFN
jgi:glucokinase